MTRALAHELDCRLLVPEASQQRSRKFDGNVPQVHAMRKVARSQFVQWPAHQAECTQFAYSSFCQAACRCNDTPVHQQYTDGHMPAGTCTCKRTPAGPGQGTCIYVNIDAAICHL